MLLSDMWGPQPAVLQLLPFSANHALSLAPNDGSATRGLRQRQATLAPAPADVGREFPVLAVTRGQGNATTTTTSNRNNNDYGSSRSRSGPGVRVSGHGGLSPDPPERCASERLPRPAHALLQSRLYGTSGAQSARVNRHGTEPMAGYHHRDQDGDILGYTTGSDAFAEIFENEAGEEKNGRHLVGGLLPKPVFQLDDVGPACTLTSTFAGSPHGSPAQDQGRLALPHGHAGGLRRSLTLTPGELDLQQHRRQLERASSGRLPLDPSYALAQPDVMGHHYHKLNVRDLPRSTTPVHDNDPDRLNMKQVIAFLQSKGKSQADAVELPRELRAKVAKDIQLLTARQSARGQLKGRVRRPSLLPSSSSSTISSEAAAGLASGTRHAPPASLHGSAKLHLEPVPVTLVPFADQGGRDFASFILPLTCPTTKNSSELKPEPCATGTSARSRPAGRAVSEYIPRPTGESADNVRSGLQGDLGLSWDAARKKSSKSKSAGTRPRQQQQKKPFRLHRFLTMVPSPRDSAPPGFAASGASSPRPAMRAAPEAVSRATQKERTLCLDLANQSRSQASLHRSKTADWENHSKVRKGSFSQNCNDGDYGSSSGSVKVRYRISAVGDRSRPGSLRSADEAVEEPHHKVTSDHGNYRNQDGGRAQIRDGGDQAGIHSFDYRNNDEDTKIIRLPYVMVDPDDDENAAVKDHTHSAGRSRVHQLSVNKTHQSAYRSSSVQHSYQDYGDVGNLNAYANNNNNKDNNSEEKAGLANQTNDLISSSYQEQKQYETAEALTLDSADQSASSLTANASYSSTSMAVSCAQSSASEDLSPYLQSEGSAERRTDLPDMEALVDAVSTLNADLDSQHAGSGTSVDSVSSSGLYCSSRDNFTTSAESFAGDPSTTSAVSMKATFVEQGMDEQTEQQNGHQPVRWKDTSSDTRFPSIRQTGQLDVGLDNIFRDLQSKVPKKVKVNVPSAHAKSVKFDDETMEQKTDCVTLSLRKERHRTRESTYMSEIGDRDASSENSAAVRLLSCVRSNVRPNLASDGSPSLVS